MEKIEKDEIFELRTFLKELVGLTQDIVLKRSQESSDPVPLRTETLQSAFAIVARVNALLNVVSQCTPKTIGNMTEGRLLLPAFKPRLEDLKSVFEDAKQNRGFNHKAVKATVEALVKAVNNIKSNIMFKKELDDAVTECEKRSTIDNNDKLRLMSNFYSLEKLRDLKPSNILTLSMDIRDAISEASSAIISEADNWQGHVGQKDFPVGTKVQFTVYTTELRYVSIYHIDSDGKVSQVFPNSKDKDSRVSGTKVIPGVDSGYDIVLSEPLGVDNVVACANKQDRYSSNTSSVETNKFRGIVLNDNETATAILSFSVSKPKNNAQQQ